jgi:hypothetical protein
VGLKASEVVSLVFARQLLTTTAEGKKGKITLKGGNPFSPFFESFVTERGQGTGHQWTLSLTRQASPGVRGRRRRERRVDRAQVMKLVRVQQLE